jgi:hypothetical protein
LATVTFVGEERDITDPEAAVLVAGQTTERQCSVGKQPASNPGSMAMRYTFGFATPKALAGLRGHPNDQIAVRNIGHEEPTLLITNDLAATVAKDLFARYAEQMIIENELDADISGFGLNALSSGLPLNVDLAPARFGSVPLRGIPPPAP